MTICRISKSVPIKLALVLSFMFCSIKSVQAQDCGAKGSLYFVGAQSLNKDAATLGQSGVDKMVRNEGGSLEFFQQADEKRKEADRLRKLGYMERSECWKRKRAAKDEERKKKKSLWGHAKKPLKKIMEQSWAAKQSADGFKTLYDSKDDYRTQLAIVSEKTQELNSTLQKRSSSRAANEISEDLTNLSIKAIERSTGNAIESFKRSMSRFKSVSIEYDRQQAKLRESESSKKSSSAPTPEAVQPRPSPLSQQTTSRQPRRSGLCPKGWSIQRDTKGQRFCRCGDIQYQDPKFLSDSAVCNN